MSKTVLFQAIQFSISKQFNSIWLIERTLSGATTLGQSGSGSYENEGVLCIPQNSSITGTSPSDCLVSHPGHWLVESYSFAEMQSVYFAAHLQPTGQKKKKKKKKKKTAMRKIIFNEVVFALAVTLVIISGEK